MTQKWLIAEPSFLGSNNNDLAVFIQTECNINEYLFLWHCLSNIKITPGTSGKSAECPQSHTSENMVKKGLLSENKASQPTSPN